MQPHLPLGLRIGYDLRDELVERPDTVTTVSSEGVPTVVDTLNREPSNSAGVDVSLQYQLRQWASLTATSRINTTTNQIAVSRDNRFVYDRSVTQDKGYGIDAQANTRGWALDAHYSEGRPESETPRQTALQITTASAIDSAVTVNYRERSLSTARSISANLSKNLGTRLLLRGTGSVTLNEYRYVITDSSYAAETGDARVDPSDPRDDYRQLYRVEATYSGLRGLSTTIGLEVSRTLTVFLKANRSDANREDKVYRADWRWTYRLTRLLTVTQRNQINSAYTNIMFRPERNRLGMSYLSITTLTSQVSPRLGLDITHNASYRPNGDYLLATDGQNSFTISDASHDYTLSSRIAYTPVNAVTISLEPYYQSTDRQTVNGGIRTPDNRRRSPQPLGRREPQSTRGAAGRSDRELRAADPVEPLRTQQQRRARPGAARRARLLDREPPVLMAPIASRIGHDTPSPARLRIATAARGGARVPRRAGLRLRGCVNPFLPAKAEPPPADGTNVNIDLNYSDPDAVTTTFAAGVGVQGRGNGRAAYLGAFADSPERQGPLLRRVRCSRHPDRTGAGKDIPVWNRDLEAAFYPYLSSLNSGEYVFKWSNYSSPSDEIDDVAGTGDDLPGLRAVRRVPGRSGLAGVLWPRGPVPAQDHAHAMGHRAMDGHREPGLRLQPGRRGLPLVRAPAHRHGEPMTNRLRRYRRRRGPGSGPARRRAVHHRMLQSVPSAGRLRVRGVAPAAQADPAAGAAPPVQMVLGEPRHQRVRGDLHRRFPFRILGARLW